MVTIDRVDSWLTIAQQALYLAVVTAVLTQMFFAPEVPQPAPEGAPLLKRSYYRYRIAILSFLLGGLLNLYTIFFFKSSSLLVSAAFLVLLVVLLVLNELNHFKWLGLSFKFALLSLCGLSFCATVVPVFVGQIGLAVFLLSMAIGCVPIIGLAWSIRKRSPEQLPRVRNQILVPFGLVLVAFLGAYLLKVIPPVPLSIPFIGVYHSVERVKDEYRLSHERPAWRFWHNGDQEFRAQPDDRVFVFFRVFSPTRFADEVRMRWYLRQERGWALQDTIPIKITGGRAEGFRGYGFKSKYQPGEWKVQIETTDEREIGRVYFTLETVATSPRSFEVDVQ
ncbi:MAG: hypothetical protein QOD26_2816 [Betaproteobacteria bacterium]|jgi:hypothetical protein|nr:hypothetical protein [Betaproteobacteria bacterium]